MSKDDPLILDYEPLIFLRCHSKTDTDTADVRTKVNEYFFEYFSVVIFLFYDLKILLILGLAGDF